MTNRLATAALVWGIAASIGGGAFSAAAEGCLVSYEEFEGNVSHIDLDACPGYTGDDRFCRLAVHGDRFTIYTFTYADNCLVNVESTTFAELNRRRDASKKN